MKTAFYDPPYGSPIEDIFAWEFLKHIDEATSFRKQVEVKTICGWFRLDFMASTPKGKRIGYECDGAQFHDWKRDEWRDAMILGADAVDSIVRIRAQDIFYKLNDVLHILSKWNTSAFSARGKANLFRLASDRARVWEPHIDQYSAMVSYPGEAVRGQDEFFIHVRREDFRAAPRQRSHLKELYRFAQSVGGGNLDGVIAARQPSQTIGC